MFRSQAMGEEGIDYMHALGDIQDPNMPDKKILERQIRREIMQLKMTDPTKARQYEEFVTKRNEIDDIMAKEFDLSEVKLYPGSEKGPHPEDDPDNYSRWFVENQPKQIYNGELTDYSDIGAKKKYVAMVRDMTENNELKTPYNYLIEEDEIYPCASYTGQPEFALFERERYNVENDDELPSVTMTTNMAPNELPPLPSDHTYNY